jgi:hypothetical protein
MIQESITAGHRPDMNDIRIISKKPNSRIRNAIREEISRPNSVVLVFPCQVSVTCKTVNEDDAKSDVSRYFDGFFVGSYSSLESGGLYNRSIPIGPTEVYKSDVNAGETSLSLDPSTVPVSVDIMFSRLTKLYKLKDLRRKKSVEIQYSLIL